MVDTLVWIILPTKVFKYVNKYVDTMVDTAKVKLYAFKSRHSINFPSSFVRDSAFPFEVGDELIATIEGDKIVIAMANKPKTQKYPEQTT